MPRNILGKRSLATDFSAKRSPEARHLAETALVWAGLQGYLMSKIHVAKERGFEKDYYDLVYTPRGPRFIGSRQNFESRGSIHWSGG